jgi:hypothetical protein
LARVPGERSLQGQLPVQTVFTRRFAPVITLSIAAMSSVFLLTLVLACLKPLVGSVGRDIGISPLVRGIVVLAARHGVIGEVIRHDMGPAVKCAYRAGPRCMLSKARKRFTAIATK